jgi:hypothetical protein
MAPKHRKYIADISSKRPFKVIDLEVKLEVIKD